MKKLFLILCLLVHFKTYSQRHDNVWIFGYHYYPNFVPALDFYFGNPINIPWNAAVNFTGGADECISNASGDLQFYSNGVGIYNYINDSIPGSSDYNPGYDGLTKQNQVILPFPNHPSQYVIIHQAIPDFNQPNPVNIAYSVVDMSANNQLGEMIFKNQPVISDTLCLGTVVSVKHANGRDWWILVHKLHSDIFYTMLLSPSGVQMISSQSAGSIMQTGMYYFSGQIKFSSDGSLLAMAKSGTSIVELYSFDRCAGQLQLTDTFDFSSDPNDTIIYGCSFSPGNEYLYVSTGKNLFQKNIINQTAFKKVATWDGTSGFNPYYFLGMYNTPDGKIYVASPSSDILHVINNPDNADTLCNFTQHSITLNSYHAGYLCEFPNFRLGLLAGSGCDTITAVNEITDDQKTLEVYPNPSNGIFRLNYILSDNKNAEINVYSLDGKIIFTDYIATFSTTYELDLSKYQSGIYFIRLNSETKTLSTKVILNKNP